MTAPVYFDQAALEARFSAERVAQLFSVQDATGVSTGTVDATTLAAVVQDVQAEIDEVLGVEYVVPIDDGSGTCPSSITEIACDIAMYRAAKRRPEFRTGKGADALKPYAEDYAAASKRLGEIRDGKRKIAGLVGVKVEPSNSGGQLTAPSVDCSPYYFLPDPLTGQGGFGGGTPGL